MTLPGEEEPEEKINYRSMGRGTGGVMQFKRRFKGFDRRRDNLTTPTIPAKFETVLYLDNNEDRAFGSVAPRFKVSGREAGDGIPGPGAYTVDGGGGTGADLGSQYGSGGAGALAKVRGRGGGPDNAAGERGKGSFASRTPRLERRVGPAPGPGAYDVARASAGAPGAAAAAAAKEPPSAAFVEPRSSNPAKFNARPTPGPGQYYESWPRSDAAPSAGAGGAPSSSSSALAPASARAQLSARGEARVVGGTMPRAGDKGLQLRAGSNDVPGPGAYKERETFRSGSCPPRAAAPSRLEKAKPQLAADAPGTSAKGEIHRLRAATELLMEDSMTSSQGASQGLPRTKVEVVPGPGEYNPKFDMAYSQAGFSTNGSSSFQKGTSHLPRTRRSIDPGPGDYDAAAPPAREHGGCCAASFASCSVRFEGKKPLAPGPAYYAPKMESLQPSTSFHLNIQRNWL